MTGCRRVMIVSVALFAGACATGRFGPSTTTPVPEGKHTLKNLSVNERDATLQRARVWQPIDTRSLDLAAGPPLPSALTIGGELTCRFVFPEKPLSGNTPKFRCEVRPDDVVKVKYGKNNGAFRAEVDALKLLAVFVQHSDSKPEQQELLCAPGRVKRDRAGNETCLSPWLVVKDLGVTFGKATALNSSTMDLDDWSGAGIWREGARCVGDLRRSLTGSLENPRIGDAGRAFLASRLLLLSDRQISDLFTAARAERRGGTIDDWVRVFKRKRDEIVKARCE